MIRLNRKLALTIGLVVMGYVTAARADYTEWEYIGKNYQSEAACGVACNEQMPSYSESPFDYFTGEVAYTRNFFGRFKGWCYCQMQVIDNGDDGGE